MENLRVSSYMIPVKLEKEKNKYILIHGYTGAMDIISEKLLNDIKAIGKEYNLTQPMIELLLKRGYLTTKTQDEEYAYVARIAKALHRESLIMNTSFTWIVSYNCNFRCPYCFENRETKNGKKKITFTKELVDIAYKAQDFIQPRKELRKNSITLYGGEPLLAENKEVVNYIVEEGKKRGYTFEAITNGYELDQFLDLLTPDGINRLQITIDGPKEIHDQRRIHYQAGGTFDKIIENLQLALDKNVKVTVRMNTDARNIEKFIELKNFFEEKQFFNYPNFNIYSARLRDYEHFTKSDHSKMTFISPKSFTSQQMELGIDTVRQDAGMYKNIYNALVEKRAISLTAIACTAQSGGNVLDPLGNIYPCWEVLGKKDFIKGTYSKNGVIWNQTVLDKWQTNIGQKEPCNHCRYALICGGGCHYHNMINGIETQCDIFRSAFNQIINKAYAKSITNV